MILELKTSAKNIEIANYILAQAIDSIENNPEVRKNLQLSHSDLTAAKRFRKAVVKALIKSSEKPQ